ncbi:MAG TPA: hypothetical protein VIW69_08310 [Candidatus Elarobacter sp.]
MDLSETDSFALGVVTVDTESYRTLAPSGGKFAGPGATANIPLLQTGIPPRLRAAA